MRQLAAIMFTDIVGYTTIMQNDESVAMRIRTKHRDIFESHHASFKGKIIQYYGDGTLSIFKSAVEAASCAAEMQKQFKAGSIPIDVRIGLHIGDIYYDGTEVFGDGVNIAARIESISKPGAVLLSEQLNNELKNHSKITTTSLGKFNFKNVIDPIEVFALSIGDLTIPDLTDIPSSLSSNDKSVAVLPFENMSTSKEYEYFSDGMTEEIITALTKVKNLKVTSRISSFHFKGKKTSISEIGRLLNVSTIVVGSVRLSGKMMRISAQLIDVSEDESIWSEKYDRKIENIFSVQDEISLQIADKLREHLGHLEIDSHLVSIPDVKIDDYTSYLKSRHHIVKMNADDIEIGMSILEKVIQNSPGYIYGYLGMHLGYTLKGTLGFMKAEDAFLKGQKYLDKAIELDPDLPECQLQKAWISFLQDWDLNATYKHLEKVYSASPIIDYYQTMASVVIVEKKIDAANHYIDIALKLDPFSDITHHLKGFIQYVNENFEEAIKYYRKGMELKPGSEVSYMELGQSLILSGKIEEALSHYEHLPIEIDNLLKIGGKTLVHAVSGNKEQTVEGLLKLKEALNSPLIERALNYLILCETVSGNYDAAIKYVKDAISMRLPMIVYLKIDPMLKPLYSIPGFNDLLKDIPTSSIQEKLTTSKYQKSLLTPEALKRNRKELNELMDTEKPYLDPFLTLRDLAEQLGIPSNYLSQLLNEGFDKNFSEFINTYRLTHFKKAIKNPQNRNFTLLAVAYESGFNSKTVFNNFFKKVMGTTPSAYLKSVQN